MRLNIVYHYARIFAIESAEIRAFGDYFLFSRIFYWKLTICNTKILFYKIAYKI